MAVSSELEFAEATPAVVLRDVSVRYRVPTTEGDSDGNRKQSHALNLKQTLYRPAMVDVEALKPMSLVVNHGESVGVIGRNGSGKSTMMRIISGQEPPIEGSVYASAPPVMLGVSAALLPELSGDQNIVLGCLAMGMSRRQIREKFDGIVGLSGLGKQIHLPLKSFSSGMGSRLQFAIASAVDPEILLIDEALNTGDDQFRDRTRRRMDELRGQAGCVFLVSHSLSTIRQVCTRVLWLDDGELLMDGKPNEVVKRYRTFIEFLNTGDRQGAAKLRRRLLKELETLEIHERMPGRRKAS